MENGPRQEDLEQAKECRSNQIAHDSEGSAKILPFVTLTETGIVLDRTHLEGSDDSKGHQSSPLVRLFKFSAAHKNGVKTQMSALTEYLKARSSSDPDENDKLLRDLAYTLSERKSLLEWRATIATTTIEELILSLDSFEDEPQAALNNPGIAFVFTGQGSQWPTMGRELLQYPVSASIIVECEERLKELGATWSLLGLSWLYE